MQTSESTSKKPRDIRTFCRRCMMEYHNAGFKLRRHGKSGRCDKCNSPKGSGYEMLD